MYLYCLILTFVLNQCSVSGINFDVNKIVDIKLNENDKVERSYFGYSLLLQRGPKPMVIVGAPKHNSVTGGSIFACDILENTGCIKYVMGVVNNGTFNGNFFGTVIDGDDETGKPFIACAPRKVTPGGTGSNMNYFLKGSCLYHGNSSSLQQKNLELNPLKFEDQVGVAKGEYYYDFAFGQAGIDILYRKETSSVIMGATGVKNWNGAIVLQSLRALSDHVIIPKKKEPVETENYDYLGYKVGYGSLSDSNFLFAGAPRAENLLGKVKLFNANKELFRSFKGEETGSYFGSAVLSQDVNDDGLDDLFIGAPTAAGATYEEGCVYFYKNALGTAVKLVGKGRKGARFGTNIVALGDIDLDSFNDVAIAAPFENDGTGVVYIFMGSADGIKTIYSQRLVPSSFPGSRTNVKGFGLGMSRGNDIDGNGHNDLAIGAFKSGQVMVIPTKPVIDFRTALEPNRTSITSNDSQMSIRFCVYYQPRSTVGILKQVDFQMKLSMDYRVKGSNTHVENVTAYSDETLCRQVDINIEQSIVDILPFQFTLTTTALGALHAEGSSVIERSVPYSHGCGDDNICQTQILVDVSSATKRIIVGLDKVVKVKVYAENAGEPGYQCQLHMEVPNQLQLREDRKCSLQNMTYICPFATRLFTDAEKEVAFDIVAVHPNTESVNITFEIKCLGENIENKELLNLGIVIQNSPYIEGKSDPDDLENNDEDAQDETDVYFKHTFVVGNFGPSPVKADVYLLLPTVKIGKMNLFEFVEAKGILRGTQVPCNPSNQTHNYDNNFDVNSLVKASLNRTILMDCSEENVECVEFFCQGDYLYKSSELAKYSVKVRTKTNLLAKFFKAQPKNKNIIGYISSAFLFNGTRVEGRTATLILSSHSTRVPLWVYILAAVLGILLLGLLIFIFYKCHFFDRRYRDKMNGERLMDQHIEMDGDGTQMQTVDLGEEKS